MEFGDVLSGVGSVGFPIVMCIMLFWYIKDEQGKTREVLNKLENTIETLKAIVENITKKGE